ncbi:MAG: T9SS type A sorting domain-containing protein, partial [Melioribacteraceae bacterium]|nr:T9SS type A sorting domain-containing protein [Melioribacteraceae bacterium]
YDVLGNEIAELVNENKAAGFYSIEFNASGLSSGIYFYSLTAGEFSKVNKMILLR